MRRNSSPVESALARAHSHAPFLSASARHLRTHHAVYVSRPCKRFAEAFRLDFAEGGIFSLANQVQKYKSSLVSLEQLGWSADDAQLTLHIAGEETSRVLNQVRAQRAHMAVRVHLSSRAAAEDRMCMHMLCLR